MIVTSKKPIENKLLNVMVNEICAPPPDLKYRFHPDYARHIKVRMHRHHAMKVMPETINMRRKLVQFVHDNYGFGKFYVCFWVPWIRYKTYNPYFVCLGPPREFIFGLGMSHKGCPYYGRGKCRKWNKTPYIPGMTCKKNRKHGQGWQVRAFIEIKERYDDVPTDEMVLGNESDFTFIWHRQKSRMHRFEWFGRERELRHHRGLFS